MPMTRPIPPQMPAQGVNVGELGPNWRQTFQPTTMPVRPQPGAPAPVLPTVGKIFR